MSFRRIIPAKIKAARGTRSLREVAARSGGAFTFGALWQWENDGVKPTDDNVIQLLQALGCQYEDISEPVQIEAVN